MIGRMLHYADATPRDLQEMLEAAPVAYVPLGALEWHGPHNVLGLDGIKASSICERTASITGGVVFPCAFWGAYDTLRNFPFTFSFPAGIQKKMTRIMIRQLHGMGFKAVVLMSGHYPPSQINFLKRESKRFSRKYKNFFVLGIPEFLMVQDMGYLGDHAASWETSIMMALNGGSVHLDRFTKGLNFAERAIRHGTFGMDPAVHASAEQGEEILNAISARLGDAVNEVLKKNSNEPFERIYSTGEKLLRKYYNPFRLGEFFRLNGITSLGEALQYLKWTCLKGQKPHPGYVYRRSCLERFRKMPGKR
jgi:creatinine amidohydrolase